MSTAIDILAAVGSGILLLCTIMVVYATVDQIWWRVRGRP